MPSTIAWNINELQKIQKQKTLIPTRPSIVLICGIVVIAIVVFPKNKHNNRNLPGASELHGLKELGAQFLPSQQHIYQQNPIQK